VLGLLAIVLATVNMVGGFVVTDRMLGMFARPRGAQTQASPAPGSQAPGTPAMDGAPHGHQPQEKK
jgi:NAD(P) transhydrogenase subunit alpha